MRQILATFGPTLTLAIVSFSCARAIQSGEIIDHYRAGRCVEPIVVEDVSPATRGWNAQLTSASGARVNVRGAQMVAGRVVVRYLPDGPEVVAADAGDYIYPTDVRVSVARTNLIVRAAGVASGIWQEAWLFEYSLDERRLL